MKSANHPINTRRIKRLLKRLIDIYSPSGKEEELVDYLYKYLRRKGIPVIKQTVNEIRENIIVAPAEIQARVAFIGHIDTVTAYDLVDFGSDQEGDLIRGLGAADMKGGCAAMVEAFLCLHEQEPGEIPLILALVVGEEETGDGAEQLVREYHFPWAIIGEPTGLDPCLSHHGYLEMQVTTRGPRKHASLAQPGRNAVEDMLNLLLRLSEHLGKQRPELVYNIRDLYSGPSGFAVPDLCEVWLDIHAPPSAPLTEITMEIEELIDNHHRSNPALEAQIHFHTVQPGYTLPEKGPVVKALKEALAELGRSWSPQPFPSHSDANFLWMAGVKPIILGPGRLEEAHQPDESVSLAQVIAAAELYYRTAKCLLSVP